MSVDKLIFDLFFDKSVVLIGPSPHLIGTGLGKIIDSYDVVCRINGPTPSEHLRDDYGSRTDVMFYNCSTNTLSWIRNKLDEDLEDSEKIKLVVCPVLKAAGSDVWQNWDKNTRLQVCENFRKINKSDTPFFHIGFEYFKYVYDQIGTEPNSGFTSLCWILDQRPSEFFLTGFSFYSQGSSYDKAYFPNNVLEQFRDNNFNPLVGHNQDLQKRFFRNIILAKYSPILKIDSFLQKVLDVQYENVVLLGS